MLPKFQRLNLTKDFKFVRSGTRRETANFIIFFRSSENVNPLVGIANSSKVFKKAHDRNRARRLAAQAVQNVYPNLSNSLNLVIMPKVSVLQASVEDLEKELVGVFGKV
jgi:ribonuclease P protein component